MPYESATKRQPQRRRDAEVGGEEKETACLFLLCISAPLRLHLDRRGVSAMELGFVGLGKMGGNMVLRLVVGSPDGRVKGTHRVVGYARDPNPDLEGVANVVLVNSIQ